MINQKQSPRIALIGDSLSGGGAERVHALLSLYFTKMGISVANCIFLDNIGYEFGGSIFNLGLVATDKPSVIRKAKRLEVFRDFILAGKFDAVIDFRMRTNFSQEAILANICPENTFYTVHSGVTEFYFPQPDSFSKIVYRRKNIVAVSKALAQNIMERKIGKSVVSIPNPVDMRVINELKNEVVPGKFVLAVGRMNDEVKQFGKLIEAYSKSSLPKNGIKLRILGEGKLREKYARLAADLGINDLIVFDGFTKNPFPYYSSALFTVLSSRNEGLPNVLIESLACGTPVVAFDCFSGPSEIVEHEKNGILVKNQDFDALQKAMDKMAVEDEFCQQCALNAASSVARFDIEIIGQIWMQMLKLNVS